MAMIRRDILKLGVSYGSGAINFGNDSIAYDRELRKLKNRTELTEFLDELTKAEAEMAALAEAQAQAEAEAEAAAAAAAAEESARAEAGATADVQAAAQVETEADPQAEGAAQAQDASTQDAIRDNAGENADPIISESKAAGSEAPEELEEPEEPEEPNPLEAAIAAARKFQDLCARLAFSQLYIQMTSIINDMNARALPPVEDILEVRKAYDAIVAYTSTH